MRCWRPNSKKYIVSTISKSHSLYNRYEDMSQSINEELNNKNMRTRIVAITVDTNAAIGNSIIDTQSSPSLEPSNSKLKKDSKSSSKNIKTISDKELSYVTVVSRTQNTNKTENVETAVQVQTTTTSESSALINHKSQESAVAATPITPIDLEPKELVETTVSLRSISQSNVLESTSTQRSTATPITNEVNSVNLESTASSPPTASESLPEMQKPPENIEDSVIKIAKAEEIEQNRVSLELLSVPSLDRNVSVSSQHSVVEEDRKASVASVLSDEPPTSRNDRRRSGVQVSTPVTLVDTLPVYEKSEEDENKIKQAIQNNEFLTKVISGKCLNDIINAMQVRTVLAKQKIVKQGDKGSEMYVSIRGKFKILKKGKVVGEFADVRVFGELAILYNSKRLATIQAATDGAVWVLGRDVYQQIVISSNLKEQDENLAFLKNVAYLNVVNEQVLQQVSNLLKPEFFPPSTAIIRQGDKGDKFYIIRAGTVTITKTGAGVLGKLGKGQCFGEMALQKEDTRQATVTAEAPGVECLTLTRADFINHFGDVEIPKIEVKKPTFKDEAEAEYQDIQLGDLKIITTLGIGGFGRVELVQYKKKKNLVFSLKYLKKIEVVHMQQEKHVYNEKVIQMNCKSPFIVRLYRTYKDNKYVYFLMEACLGGDLFSLIQKQKGKRFDEKDARFYSACVVEALGYLHSKGIIYRDLKPENLMVDKLGYLKLTDFGFAKRMPARGKTFTFAGTPEYVAPEIVLNRGHDKSVDYWAFGVFIFELLTGKTPFKTGDTSHMRTYNKILNGIINFPQSVNPKARNLIEKLCRAGPAERLGMQKGGIRDIKIHKWYQDFDWIKFGQRQISAPIKPKIKDPLDTSNFDRFALDKNIPPDELSGWDNHF